MCQTQPAAIPEELVSHTHTYGLLFAVAPIAKFPKLLIPWVESPTAVLCPSVSACDLLREENRTLKFRGGSFAPPCIYKRGKRCTEEMPAKTQPPKLGISELEKATVQVA